MGLARSVAAEIGGWTDLPVVFYGHSLGSLVAFETARLLLDRGADNPIHLMVGAAGRRICRSCINPSHNR